MTTVDPCIGRCIRARCGVQHSAIERRHVVETARVARELDDPCVAQSGRLTGVPHEGDATTDQREHEQAEDDRQRKAPARR